MSKKQLILNLLGLAMRARKVVLGTDFVIKEAAKHPGSVLFLASDAGDNVRKKIEDKSKVYHMTVIKDFNTLELSNAIGKENRVVVLVIDKGFCRRFLEYVNS